MNCKVCKHCIKGYFDSRPDDYVCIGFGNPLSINDRIVSECSIYEKDEWKDHYTKIGEDCFVVTYDFGTKTDPPVLSVSRMAKTDAGRDCYYGVNTITGDKAFYVYALLTGCADLRDKGAEKIKDILPHLKCIIEHIMLLSRGDSGSLDFNVKMLERCISRLEEE